VKSVLLFPGKFLILKSVCTCAERQRAVNQSGKNKVDMVNNRFNFQDNKYCKNGWNADILFRLPCSSIDMLPFPGLPDNEVRPG
jgi:hypothetical protein